MVAIQSHDYVGPVLVACCLEVPSADSTLQTLLLGVGPDLHALPDVAGPDSSCVARSAQLRCLLPHSSQLHGLVAAELLAGGFRYVAAFGPYGLVLCQVSVGPSGDVHLQVGPSARLPDWPLDVAWLHENSALMIAYGRTFLEKWRLQGSVLCQEVRLPGPEEVSFLYSASLHENKGACTVAAGTFDGFVVLWRSDEASVQSTATQLLGHQGAIFQIRFYFNGSTLLTASDDRTVRRWEAGAETEDWHCRATCRGHGCRVWDAVLCGERIVSASEDSVVRIFSMQGALLRELQGHQTRGVRCLEPLGCSAVVSGGEDGAVKLWPLAELGTAVVHRWPVPEVDDWIREVLLLSHVEALVATNYGSIYQLRLAEDGGMTSELLFHEANVCFTSMAQGDGGTAIWTGCADGRGLVFSRRQGELAVATVEVFRQCRVSAAFGGHGGRGLFCDHAGRIRLFLADAHSTAVAPLAEKQIAAPKKSDKNQRLLCGLLLSSDPVLWLLGDEHGSLHLVSLQEPQQSAAHEGKVLCLLSLLHLQSEGDGGLEFLSSGADGVVLRHRVESSTGRWSQLAAHRPGCGLRHLSHVQHATHATQAAMPALFLGAFQSADFVLWDTSAGLEVWRHRCGGAKRPNSLVVDGGHRFTFAFSTSKALELHSSAAAAGAAPRALRPALHGREIHQICCLQAPLELGSLEASGLLATASEDTSLRLVQLAGGAHSLCPTAAAVRFPGSVRALCSIPLSSSSGYGSSSGAALLVSGGAKGTLMAHLLPAEMSQLLKLWSTSLGEEDPVTMEDDAASSSDGSAADEPPEPEAPVGAPRGAERLEERVMAVSCVKLQSSQVGLLLAAASSSGFLRTWRLQLDDGKGALSSVQFLQRVRACNTTALCMECFTGPMYHGVIVGSADGRLACLKLQEGSEVTKFQEDLQLHQAGVNDLALHVGRSRRMAVLTAGDDHALGLCHYAMEEDGLRLLGSRLIESAHFSAVRSVAWTQSWAVSVGLDRRLRLWQGESLELVTERILSCTEPETMAVLPAEAPMVVVAGRGVEVLSIAG